MKAPTQHPNGIFRKGFKVSLRIRDKQYLFDLNGPTLGKGAMGLVFRGVESSSGIPVAIKQVNPRFADNPEIRRRARQEARMEFDHPNLVQMLGFCESPQGKGDFFIVSRMVNGENIDKFVNENIRTLPQPEKKICELFLPVLDALEYLHQKGILHMDVKPSNIMVEQGRNVRLMDLGIAYLSQQTPDGGSSSGVMGTPRYAAPEQFNSNADGEGPNLTRATDIYEAGVTLYELITRQNPYKAPTVAEAKKLHQAEGLSKNSMISPAVYQVVCRATAINPQERYQTAAEMKAALKQALMVNPEPWYRRLFKRLGS
jgi:serine/threonine-protein kinase